MFGWYHRVGTRCYREGTLASKASQPLGLRRDSKSHLSIQKCNPSQGVEEDKPDEARIPLSVRALARPSPLQFNYVGKGSDARPPQSGFARQLPLYDLRFASVDKGSDTRPPQSGFARQLPLYDLRFASVDKGSDTYQMIYRDINEIFAYIGLISVGAGLVSDLKLRVYRVNGPSSRKA
ncbi:MAG: hypothetical protein CL920_32225 [Deltaproteobacteria bacterium]|nr:hypothetical protein [Deltaproteobacteria bacterium]